MKLREEEEDDDDDEEEEFKSIHQMFSQMLELIFNMAKGGLMHSRLVS